MKSTTSHDYRCDQGHHGSYSSTNARDAAADQHKGHGSVGRWTTRTATWSSSDFGGHGSESTGSGPAR